MMLKLRIPIIRILEPDCNWETTGILILQGYVLNRSNNIKFTVTQIGENTFQATFTDSNGNIASLLPDRTLTYPAGNGKTVSVTIKGGAGVFTVDANDGDIIKATVDNSRRDNTFDSNSKTSNPVNGVTLSYEYPAIPYENGGNGNGNSNGNGDGSGNRGLSNQGSSDNNGNSTHSQNSNPSSSGTNQVNDASQNYETPDTISQGAYEGSSGDAGSKSVVKQILIDEDDIFRVTGISFIVLLIIVTIGFYYRDDIKEMNSKR